MKARTEENKDLSLSLFWATFAPINTINETNCDAVIDWLNDRSSILMWFTSINTGSVVLLTLFGNKPSVTDPSGVALSISLLLMFFSILCNMVAVWQIQKWKYAIRVGLVSKGKLMTTSLEITSWLGFISFLGALVMAALGNSAALP